MGQVYAATNTTGGINICDYWPLCKDEFSSLGSIVSYLLPKIFIVAGVIFFFLIVIAGIGVLSGAGGDDAHAKEKTKNFLTYSLIGFIIIFVSYWILQIINYLTQGALGG